MSVRIGNSLFSGSVRVGVTSLGVLGSAVPTSGEDGAGFFEHEIAAEDLTKEVMAIITTAPSGANVTSFDAEEDGTFVLIVTADGTYTIEYDYYEDGVFQNSGSLDVVIGAASTVLPAFYHHRHHNRAA